MGKHRPGGVGVYQLQAHARPGRSSISSGEFLQLPGQIPGEAVLGQGAAGEAAADREQHRDAAADRFGGVGVALGIEVKPLLAATAPSRYQAAPLGHDSQLIAGGRGERPMGVGLRALLQERGAGGHRRRAGSLARP